jgi:serine/threonine-protein kinase
VGTDSASAKATLEGLGLKVDTDEDYSESVAKDLVISIDPDEGATAHRGDTVKLKISKGPPLVTVPNVVGQSESGAKEKLQDAGFKVDVDKPLGFSVFGVNSQSPGGGSKAPKGSTVRITVV